MPPLAAPAKLNIEDDERTKLGALLLSKIRNARNAMSNMLDDTEDLRDLYESNLPAKNDPWEGCSNTNLPLIQPHVDTAHASINNIIFGVEPWQLVNVPDELAEEPDIKERSMHIENLLQSMLEKRMKFKSHGDMAFLEMLLSPAAVLAVDWREEYRTVRRIVQEEDEYGQIKSVVKPVQDVKHKGPWLELVDLDSFVIAPMSRRDIEQSVLVGHRVSMTYDQVKRKVKSNHFDEDYVDKIIGSSVTESSDTSDSRDEQQRDRANVEGTDTDLYKFWYVIYGYDENKDGLNEDCVFVVHEQTGVIVSAQAFPYWHGIRNYVRLAAFPRPKNFFGRSQPQILEHCQRGMNTVHNQRVDATTIRINPMFKRRMSSRNTGEDIDWRPGGIVDVDDMNNDIAIIDVNPFTPGIDIEQTYREYGELADGVNTPGQGGLNKGKRLATELNIANAQGGVRMADIVRRVQESLTQIAYQVLGLCYQFMSDEELALYKVPREDLILPWEIEGHGNTTTANKMQRRQEAEMLYTMLQSDPFVTADLRRGYNVTKNLLLAHDIMDVENWIGSESDVQVMVEQQQQEQLMQQQAQMMQQGATHGVIGNPVMPEVAPTNDANVKAWLSDMANIGIQGAV